MRRMRRAGPLSVILLVAAAAIVGCGPSEQTLVIRIRHSAFDVTDLTVRAGDAVTFVFVNEDPIDHEWLIGDEAFHEAHRTGTHATHGDVPHEVSIPALATVSTTLTFDRPGTLAFICHLPAHEAYGMVGTVTVEA